MDLSNEVPHSCDNDSKLGHGPTRGKMENPIVTQRPRWHHDGEINYLKAGAGGSSRRVFLFIFYDVSPLLPGVVKDPAFDMWVVG